MKAALGPQTSCQRRVGLLTFALAFGGPGIVPVLAQTAESEERGSIESLLNDGWHTSAMDGYSAFIVFRHPDQKHLVQCRAGYDVTREKRVQTNATSYATALTLAPC